MSTDTGPFTLPPRFAAALNPAHRPPGKWDFWVTAAHHADLFAYGTASEGKGGPFGTSLWIFHAPTERYVMVGQQDSNAVVSKGVASAHAEAENLSPANRAEVVRFLLEDQRKQQQLLQEVEEVEHLSPSSPSPSRASLAAGYAVVQVSSGESCPSCRSKQVAFAEELYSRGLLVRGRFFVVFKACYERTFEDAGFNDAPYDMLFRAVLHRRLPSLLALNDMLEEDAQVAAAVRAGKMCAASVKETTVDALPRAVADLIDTRGWANVSDAPAFAIVYNSLTSEVLAAAERSSRRIESSSCDSPEQVNALEQSPMCAAIAAAAAALRSGGSFESWDFGGAHIFTNIGEIGPVGFGDSLWSNVGTIFLIRELTSPGSTRAGREVPHLANWDLFLRCAAEYNDGPEASLQVAFSGSPDAPSVAHMLWRAKIMHEDLERENATLNDIAESRVIRPDGSPAAITGPPMSSQTNLSSKRSSSHYNGKKTTPESVNVRNSSFGFMAEGSP